MRKQEAPSAVSTWKTRLVIPPSRVIAASPASAAKPGTDGEPSRARGRYRRTHPAPSAFQPLALRIVEAARPALRRIAACRRPRSDSFGAPCRASPADSRARWSCRPCSRSPALVVVPTTLPSARIASPPISGAKPSTVRVASFRARAFIADAAQRVAADEVALVERHREAEPGLVGIGVRRDVGRPVDIALLQPQRFDGAVAGVDRARARRPPASAARRRGRHIRSGCAAPSRARRHSRRAPRGRARARSRSPATVR